MRQDQEKEGTFRGKPSKWNVFPALRLERVRKRSRRVQRLRLGRKQQGTSMRRVGREEAEDTQ